MKETEKKFCLNGMDNDRDRTKLIEEIISNITHETPSEHVQREVEMINYVERLRRTSHESTVC